MVDKMDHSSVQIFELSCPRISDANARSLQKSKIGRFLIEEQQELLKRRILEIDTLIPSFRSLFDDLNYLEVLGNTIKKLHRPKLQEDSLCDSLQNILRITRQGHGSE